MAGKQSKTRQKFTREYKLEAVRLCSEGTRSVAQVAPQPRRRKRVEEAAMDFKQLHAELVRRLFEGNGSTSPAERRAAYRGTGPVVTFSHGWPFNSDAWDGQMLFLVQNGYRCVAVDRRGHGRSSQVGYGNDMDHYADDVGAVIHALDLNEATLVGHSTGGGEAARYYPGAPHGLTATLEDQ